MDIQVSDEISQKDLFNLHVDTLRLGGGLALYAGLPLMGVAYLVSYARGSGSDLILFIGVFCLLFPLLVLRRMRGMAKKIKQQNASFRQPITYRLTNEALHTDTFQGTSEVRWTDAWDAVEGRNAYYVFLSSVQTMILPKQWFSAEEKAQVSSFLKTAFPVRKKRGRKVLYIALACFFVISAVAMMVSSLIQ